MTDNTYFLDTNVWLYLLFDGKNIEVPERDRKRNIAISITSNEEIIITKQVLNEVSANLLKKQLYYFLE